MLIKIDLTVSELRMVLAALEKTFDAAEKEESIIIGTVGARLAGHVPDNMTKQQMKEDTAQSATRSLEIIKASIAFDACDDATVH